MDVNKVLFLTVIIGLTFNAFFGNFFELREFLFSRTCLLNIKVSLSLSLFFFLRLKFLTKKKSREKHTKNFKHEKKQETESEAKIWRLDKSDFFFLLLLMHGRESIFRVKFTEWKSWWLYTIWGPWICKLHFQWFVCYHHNSKTSYSRKSKFDNLHLYYM